MEAAEPGGGGGGGGDQQQGPPALVDLCLAAAAAAGHWRVQRRSVGALPPDLANALLACLLRRGVFDGAPHLLERFAECATAVALDGAQRDLGPAAPQLVAWLGGFRCLEELSIQNTRRLRDAHLAPLAQGRLPSTLRSLSLRGCGAAGGPAALASLRRLTALRALDLALTGFGGGTSGGGGGGAGRAGLLSELAGALPGITRLSLAGLQLDDAACRGAERLTGLRDLDLSDAVVTPRLVEGTLGALTRLTRLRLAWCGARVLPVFGSLERLDVEHTPLEDVAHSAGAGGEMKLRALRCAGCAASGVGALALEAVVSASAPVLEELEAAMCHAAGQPALGPLWLLPALAGAARLRRLDLSFGPASAAGPGPGQWLLPLEALGVTQLSELIFQNCPLRGGALGDFLSGVTSLRRLDLSGGHGGAGGGGGGGAAAIGGGGAGGVLAPAAALDDDALAPLLRAGRLPLLEELDLSWTSVQGRFEEADGGGGGGGGEGSGGGGASGAEGGAPAAALWRRLPALRSLRLHGSAVCGRAAAAALGDALGRQLTLLTIGRAGGGGQGGALSAPALAALCSRMPVLRVLRVEGGTATAPQLEACVSRLPRLARLELAAQNPLLCDAARLSGVAAALAPAARVLLDGKEVRPAHGRGGSAAALAALAAAAAADGGPFPSGARNSSSCSGIGGAGARGKGAGGSSCAGVGKQGAAVLAAFDQRLRYTAEQLERLSGSPGVAARAAGVRAGLLRSLRGPSDASDDGGGGGFDPIPILRSDW